MTAAELLDSAFRLFRVTLPRCLPWSMLAVLFGQAPRALDLLRNSSGVSLAHKDALWWTISVLGGVANLLLFALILLRQGAVGYGLQRDLRSDLSESLRQAPGIVVISLLWAIPLTIAGVCAASGSWGAALLLAIPAMYFSIAGGFAAYLRLLQQRTVLASLSGSVRLVLGHWWRTAGVLAVAVVAVMVLYALGAVAAVVAMQLVAAADFALLSVVTTVVVVLVAAIFVPMLVALGHTLFADLQRRDSMLVPTA